MVGLILGISQLVHWLLGPARPLQVVDLGLSAVATRSRLPLFRFEGVPPVGVSLFAGDHRSTLLRLGVRASRPGLSLFHVARLPFENCIASTSIFVLPSY
jgi:hypothetical protein